MTAPALEEVDPARWDALLARIGVTDVYCAHGYVQASAALVGAEPRLLHLAAPGGDVVFAVLLRDDPRDAVTPYGYGGPIGVGDDPPYAAFGAAYEAWCASSGVLTTFAVFHPLAGNAAHADALGFHAVPLDGTVAWALGGDTPPRERMHKHHRRMVRRAERAGLTATVSSDGELGEFVALYEDAMRRLDASSFYLFPEPYWEALARDVELHRVDVRDADGTLAAGVLGMGAPPWLHYHLGAASEEGRGTGASHLALSTLAEWGREHGYATLHLGGGVSGRADSLLEYKQRFAPDSMVPAATGRAVHDRDTYARLTGSDAIDWAGFFPAYRASY